MSKSGEYFAYSNLEKSYVYRLDLASLQVKKIKEMEGMQ